MESGDKNRVKQIEIEDVCMGVPTSACMRICIKTHWKTDQLHMKGDRKNYDLISR